MNLRIIRIIKDGLPTYYVPMRHYFHLYYRIPDTDPYWKDMRKETRKECLHQQVTRAVPDWHCHLGPRQIVRTHQGFMKLLE